MPLLWETVDAITVDDPNLRPFHRGFRIKAGLIRAGLIFWHMSFLQAELKQLGSAVPLHKLMKTWGPIICHECLYISANLDVMPKPPSADSMGQVQARLMSTVALVFLLARLPSTNQVSPGIKQQAMVWLMRLIGWAVQAQEHQGQQQVAITLSNISFAIALTGVVTGVVTRA